MQKKSAFQSRLGKIGGGIARGAITATLVASMIPTAALAATSSDYDLSKIADGTYTGTAQVTPDEDQDFTEYTLTASVTVADHKVTNVVVSGGGDVNAAYIGWATNGRTKSGDTYTGVVNQITANNSTANVDTVSGATCSSKAIKEAVDNALASAPEVEPTPATGLTSWVDIYKNLGVDTSKATYDVVTSATHFTGHHAGDIASIVNKATDSSGATTGLNGVNLTGKEATVTPKLSSAEYQYSCSYGDGEFVIRPDDTVEGYTWNDFFDNAYAVTISDGTTTVGALPWQDWYGEHSTSGYHYNKFEIAINNGTSKGSNQGNVNRYAAFYDANGNLKAGNYTVTIYSEGYEPLVAENIQVLPTYTGEVSFSDVKKSDHTLTVTGLPADAQNAKATVSYTVGRGRNAKTTTVADGVAVAANGTVALDSAQLNTIPAGVNLSVEVTTDNYAPISSTVKLVGEYTYGYAGLTWAEYYANEAVADNTDTSSNTQLDTNGESDKGGYDVVTRATTNHGLGRGSYQAITTITTESGKTYTVNSWKDGSTFVDSDGVEHTFGTKSEEDKTVYIDGTEVFKSSSFSGLKYVPVAVENTDLEAFKASHTFVENGSELSGGQTEGSIESYDGLVADVDENTNGLKTAVASSDADGNTSFSFSAAKRDGTTSGIKDAELKTVDLSSMGPVLRASDGSRNAVGSFGESIRLDFTENYGELASAIQSVEWTYYGSDSTRSTAVANYGTKFAADNWMHRKNGIELGLTNSYRANPFSNGYDGTGYWRVTIHALGYKDASYDFEVTKDNLAKVDYDDVYTSWYSDGVDFCKTKKIMTGYDNGLFGVGDNLTRGQFATILWRIAEPEAADAYDKTTAKDETPSNVSGNADGQYYTAAVNWAVENGVITGYDNHDGTFSFGANDPVTPEQMATIIARYTKASASADDVAALSDFTDGSSISSWARDGVAWAKASGLITGYDSTDGTHTLRPQENIARERAATIIKRAYDNGILG